MPWLIVEKGPERGRDIELNAGCEIVFGREASVDFATTDMSFSRHHFVVMEQDGSFHVKDLDSTHGTFVNGWKITEAELHEGDTITAGESLFSFLISKAGRGLVGKVVGGYQIQERMGRGGMGTVYRAKQIALDRDVALKVLSSRLSDDKTFVNKFFKEAQAAARLNHPNVVQVFDVREEQGLYLISLEMMDRGTVQDLATKERQLDFPRVLGIARDAAQGLVYAQKKNIVHGDIKPDNLMMNADGHIKISDLGLARDAGEVAHQGDEGIFGTPHFIAPEQALGQPTDTRSDIYSLGATLYRLVSGRTPFKGENIKQIVMKQIHEEPPDIRTLREDCPEDLADMISVMMAKKPGERFQTAEEVLTAISSLGTDGILSGSPRGMGRIVAAAAVVLCVALAVVYMLTRETEPDPTKDPENEQATNTQNKTPGPDSLTPRVDPEIERKALELKVQGARLNAQEFLQSLERQGMGRDIPSLQQAVEKFNSAAALGEGTVEATKAQNAASTLTAKITALEEEAFAAAQKIEQLRLKAEKDWTDLTGRISGEVKKDSFAGALTHATEGLPRLLQTHREDDAKKIIPAILEKMRQRHAAIRALAETRVKEGDFDSARNELAAIITRFNPGQKQGDVYSEVQGFVTAAIARSGQIRAMETARRDANRRADNALVYGILNRYYRVMKKSFTPDSFLKEMDGALLALNTDEFRERLTTVRSKTEKATAAKDAFIAFVGRSSAARIKLTGKRSGTVVSATRETITLERRGTTREVKWEEIDTRTVYRQMLRKVTNSPESSLNLVVALMECGLLNDALKELDTLAEGPDAESLQAQIAGIRADVNEEIAARTRLGRILELYANTTEDAGRWFTIRQELKTFFDDCRHTRTFVIHSNGTTPLVVIPKGPGKSAGN